MPQPFDYPENPHEYRHGPSGYNSYQRYRPWVRDEYNYRCVYCLFRESWCPILRFHLDHFRAQAIDNAVANNYRNLVYACPTCNASKSDQTIPSPTIELIQEHVNVKEDGTIECSSKVALKIIRKLGLDLPDFNEWRRLIIDIVSMAAQSNSGKFKGMYEKLMGYAEDLPDLGRKRPPQNSRKQGIKESAYELRKSGKLPTVY